MKAKKHRPMSEAHVAEVAQLFGMLSEPARLRLLSALMEQTMTVSELVGETEMKQANVSKHLGMLLNTRFVAKEREGAFVRYRIADKNLYRLCELMCGRIEADARLRAAELAR